MGFIFQPGTTRPPTSLVRPVARTVAPGVDRVEVAQAALEALTLGDADCLARILTEDVRFRSPHVSVATRDDLLRAVGQPEPALGDIDIVLWLRAADGSSVAAEWRLEATLVAPILFGDNVLIDPSVNRLRLLGALFAEYDGERISSLRCYFDDSELLDGLPAPAHPLRLAARWHGAPGGSSE